MPEKNLNIDTLISYRNNPFALYEGKRMTDMVESIRECGIISPVVVRPADNGKFEILSGHNRIEAARTLGIIEVPAIIKEGLNDDEAALIVTESNLIQRSFADLKHSERAVVLKNHLEAMKKFGGQGKRNDLLDFLDDETCGQLDHKLKSRDKVAEQYALSEKTVRRYVRLAKLPKEILLKVDDGKIKFIPAVELSWLSETELVVLTELLEDEKLKISLKCAGRLREESAKVDGKLSRENIAAIISEKTDRNKTKNVRLSGEILERLENHGEYSVEILGNIVSLYLDMLERGDAPDLFSEKVEETEYANADK